jgi:Zn-dependent peptidase ImmA (M78 family)
VAINRDHPPERQRWSLTHELGHFLRDRESGDILDDSESMRRAEEIFPESFTTELLMPRAGIQKRFADRCRAGKFTPIDLSALAQAFAVSFQAMALRLEELRLLPRGSYDRVIESRIHPQSLAKHDAALSPSRPPRARLPERYVALAVAAYDRGLLSEGELAEYLDTDVAAARHIYQEHQSIRLEDGTQLPVDFGAGDLRSA